MSDDQEPVDNGVNVEALLGAREALTEAPEAAKFKWRAKCEWKRGTHSRSTVEGFYGLGEEQQHKTAFTFDADHPGGLRVRGPRRNPGRNRARRAGELPDRGHRGRRPAPRDPAALGHGDASRAGWTSRASSASTATCATASTASR